MLERKEMEFNNPAEAESQRKEMEFDANKKPMQPKFTSKDYGNVRVYPNETGSNMDKNNKWIGKRYSLMEAHNLNDDYLKKNLVGKTKSGADVYKMPDGYFSGNPRINDASFKNVQDLEDFEKKSGEHRAAMKENTYLDDYIKNYKEPKQTYTPFKLDRAKYKDVEETPYGFIYNVNGRSITDVAGQRRAFGEPVDPNKNYGFLYNTPDNDESYYETFEDAYNAINKEKPTVSKRPSAPSEEDDDYEATMKQLKYDIRDLDQSGILKQYDVNEIADHLNDKDVNYWFSRQMIERALSQYLDEENKI